MIDFNRDVVRAALPDENGDRPSAYTHSALLEYLVRKFNRETVPVDTFGFPWVVVLHPTLDGILYLGLRIYSPANRIELIRAHRETLDETDTDVVAVISEVYMKTCAPEDYEDQKGKSLKDDLEAQQCLAILAEQRGHLPKMVTAPFKEDGLLSELSMRDENAAGLGPMRFFADLEPCH